MGTSAVHLCLFDILNLMQVVTGAVTIVDNVESWPTPVVEKESNRYNSNNTYVYVLSISLIFVELFKLLTTLWKA